MLAEEVRNLAQRSAEAARNTAELIDQSQSNANGGVETSREVTRTLEEVLESTSQVSELVQEVGRSSQEQSRNVGEINKAVTQMDQVTQNNAATAEESASASEELSGQARELNAMVSTLAEIVKGGGSGPKVPVALAVDQVEPNPTTGPLQSAPEHWVSTEKAEAPEPWAPSPGAEEVIPLEEDELLEL